MSDVRLMRERLFWMLMSIPAILWVASMVWLFFMLLGAT